MMIDGWLLNLAALFGGLALLVVGGEGLVQGSVALARRFSISPLVIGLTVVGFGTSSPELVVSVLAAIQGAPGLALGNVVGSNIANMLLILGIAAAMFPLTVHRNALRRDGLVMLAVTGAFFAIGMTGMVSMTHGAVMLAALALYMSVSVWWDRRPDTDEAAALHREEAEDIPVGPYRGWAVALAVLGGIAGLAAGAHFVVVGASAFANGMGISDEVIGLSIVAIGTSLPELAAAVAAARARHADVCVGNVIGSNIFNVLGIVGAAALAAPLPFSAGMIGFDLWVLLGVSVGLMGVMLSGYRITRWEGVLFLLAYALYMSWHVAGAVTAS
jgi:cation:H+ antiporter